MNLSEREPSTSPEEIYVDPKTVKLSLADRRFTWFCGTVTLAAGVVSISEGRRLFIDLAQGRGPYLDDAAGLVFTLGIAFAGWGFARGPWKNRENIALRMEEGLKHQAKSIKGDGI